MLPAFKFESIPPQGTDRSFKPLFYEILIILNKFTRVINCKLLVVVITFIIRVISASTHKTFFLIFKYKYVYKLLKTLIYSTINFFYNLLKYLLSYIKQITIRVISLSRLFFAIVTSKHVE